MPRTSETSAATLSAMEDELRRRGIDPDKAYSHYREARKGKSLPSSTTTTRTSSRQGNSSPAPDETAGGALVGETKSPNPYTGMVETLGSNAPQMLGSIYGAIKGAELGASAAALPIPGSGPVGATIGGLAGAYVGGAVGKTAELGARTYFNIDGQPISFNDAVERTLRAGEQEFTGELIGKGLFVGTRILRPFLRSPLSEKAVASMRTLKEEFEKALGIASKPGFLGKLGRTHIPFTDSTISDLPGMGRLTQTTARDLATGETGAARLLRKGGEPKLAGAVIEQGGLVAGEMTENRLHDVLQGVAEGSLVGGGRITKFNRTRTALLDMVLEDIGNQFGKHMDPADIGVAVRKALRKELDVRHAAVTAYLNTAEELSQNASISLGALQRDAGKLPEQFRGLVYGLSPDISFRRARVIRKALTDFLANPKKAAGETVVGAQKMLTRLDIAIDKGLRNASQDAVGFFKDVKQLEKGIGLDYDSFIRGLMSNNSRNKAAINRLLRQGDYIDINKVLKLVPEDVRDHLRRGMVDEITQGVVSTGEVQVAKLRGKLNRIGDKALNTLLGQGEAQRLRDITGALEHVMEQRARGKPGSVSIALTQAGAAGLAVKTKRWKSLAEILGIPGAIAQVMTRPRLTRLMVRGLKQEATGQGISSRLAGRIIRELTDANVIQYARDQVPDGVNASSGAFVGSQEEE